MCFVHCKNIHCVLYVQLWIADFYIVEYTVQLEVVGQRTDCGRSETETVVILRAT